MPFAGYKDMDSCIAANQDKDSPGGYCAAIHKKATGEWPGKKKEYIEDAKQLYSEMLVRKKMNFNQPLKILTESFTFKEQAGDSNKVTMSGLALTLGKPTRNGVIYSLKDDSILKSMVGKPFLDTHNDNSALNTFGHVNKFWREGNNLMYEVDVDPEETKFIRKAKRGDLPGVSVQVLCDTAEENHDGNIHANIDSFLELSAVTIPGEGDSTATLLEAFGRKPKGTIIRTTGGNNMKEQMDDEELQGGQTPEVNPRPDLQEQADGATPGFSMTRCIKKMASHMDEPASFCRWAFDKGYTKYGESVDSDEYLEGLYNDYETFVKKECSASKREDLTTDNGNALIADEAPLKKKEAIDKDKELEEKCSREAEKIYDPLKKKMVAPNYEGEDQLQDALDDIQDTGSKVKPEDERNLIPGAKKEMTKMTETAKKVQRKLSELTARVKRIEINKKIERINNKLEGIKNGKNQAKTRTR